MNLLARLIQRLLHSRLFLAIFATCVLIISSVTLYAAAYTEDYSLAHQTDDFLGVSFRDQTFMEINKRYDYFTGTGFLDTPVFISWERAKITAGNADWRKLTTSISETVISPSVTLTTTLTRIDPQNFHLTKEFIFFEPETLTQFSYIAIPIGFSEPITLDRKAKTVTTSQCVLTFDPGKNYTLQQIERAVHIVQPLPASNVSEIKFDIDFHVECD